MDGLYYTFKPTTDESIDHEESFMRMQCDIHSRRLDVQSVLGLAVPKTACLFSLCRLACEYRFEHGDIAASTVPVPMTSHVHPLFIRMVISPSHPLSPPLMRHEAKVEKSNPRHPRVSFSDIFRLSSSSYSPFRPTCDRQRHHCGHRSLQPDQDCFSLVLRCAGISAHGPSNTPRCRPTSLRSTMSARLARSCRLPAESSKSYC